MSSPIMHVGEVNSLSNIKWDELEEEEKAYQWDIYHIIQALLHTVHSRLCPLADP